MISTCVLLSMGTDFIDEMSRKAFIKVLFDFIKVIPLFPWMKNNLLVPLIKLVPVVSIFH
jgi:hypothetical protein